MLFVSGLTMIEFGIFAYGMLISIVLSGATRNKKARKANPLMLEYLGYMLCGASLATCALLMGYALAQALTPLR